jgi:hypothetical protein
MILASKDNYSGISKDSKTISLVTISLLLFARIKNVLMG